MYKIVKVDMLYEPIPEVQVDKSEIAFTFLSGSDTITATSTKDIEYILIDDTNAFSVTQNGNQFTIRSTDNMSLNSRTATIKFRSYNSKGQYIDTVVPITQEAAPLASTTTASIDEYTTRKNTEYIEFDVVSYYPIEVSHNNINGYITNIAITNNVITDSLTTKHVTITLDINQFVKKEVNEIAILCGFVGNFFNKNITVTSYYPPIYGVTIDYTKSDPSAAVTRVATDMTLHATLPVHEAMLPCDIDPSTGTITYLNKNDLKKDIDGNTITVPSTSNTLNRMIELPECWLCTAQTYRKSSTYVILASLEEFTSDDVIELLGSDTKSISIGKIPKRYIAMYEGYQISSKIRSIPGKNPDTSVSGSNFHSLCRANNSNNYDWNMLTSDVWNFVNMMFIIEYKTLNSQLSFNSTLTSEGYHQGGLGAGITNGKLTANPTLTNTNSYGADGGTTYCCYRGIVNPFGNCLKELVDVYLNYDDYSTTEAYFELRKSYNKSAYTRSNPSYSSWSYIFMPKNSGYIKSFIYTVRSNGKIDQYISTVGGSDSTYYCDYYYQSASKCGWFTGGDYGTGSNAGLWCSGCSDSVGNSGSHIGCRLTYLPNDPD